MAIKKKLAISLIAVGVIGAGIYAYGVFAAQGAGSLAQAPLNIQANIKPAFIMAVDDSGSMTFQTMFPGQDGEACWNASRQSFFDSDGKLYTSGSCNYFHVVPGPRIGTNRYGIPPIDSLGFARSSDYNPSYFNPSVTYEPWIKPDMAPYPDANVSATRIHPDEATTVDLFSPRFTTADPFRVQNGMVIPAGVRYYYGSTTYANASGTTWNSGVQTIYIEHIPAVFYLKYTSASDPLPTGYTAGDRVQVKNACGNGCDMWRYYPSSAQAKQNFANWFSFYGNRNRAMIAGMTRAMADIRDMRVGYFTINGTKPAQLPMRDLTTPADKSALYTSMLALGASGGTPNRQAVDYIGSQFMRTDKGAPILNQCQKNSGMLFTDGYSNGGGPTAAEITGLGIPFDPTPANSMAAIATKYYQTNLREDLPAGKVRVPEACSQVAVGSLEWKRLDCNTNLHMNFFGITLGARGNLFDPDVEKDPYTDPTVYGHWPGREDDKPSTVDDIWHAAVNTRGEYINARSPVEITDAMRRVLASAGGGSTPSGSLGLTGARIGDGSFTVTPSYTARNESTDWYSTLLAQSVASNPITGETSYAKLWEATEGSRIPAASSRNHVFRAKNAGSGVKPSVAQFTASSVTAAELCADSLSRCTVSGSKDGITGTGSRLKLSLNDIVLYLLGDQSREVQNGGNLRDRTTRLGDIVNSTPVISSPYLDYGYRSLRTGTYPSATYPYRDSYATYLAAKKAADKPVVYAGANDGMLHAFDGKTGNELFAYIPVTSLGHMGNLLFPYAASDKENQVFSHTYFVDGPLTVSDAYVSGAWKSVLVGTAGAGGRGVFALDVTAPGSFGASSVMWDINDKVNDSGIAKDIGHVLGKPVIIPVNNGGTVSWKAIFGNGYNSVNQNAVLFVVDIATGAVSRIKAEEASPPTGPNGLGNIIVLDRWVGSTKGAGQQSGRDGFADTVYAADQNGAVWRFDLRDNSAGSTPVFIAADADGTRQPILGGIDAAAAPGGGVMLYFGTGSFSFDGDKTDTQLQSLYGIIDRGTAVSRSSLLQQVITQVNGERKLTSNGIGGQSGWYIDLAVGSARKGERFVGYPRVESGIVFFATYEPQSTNDCAGDGFNRIYGVYALSGGSAMNAVRIGKPDGNSPGAGSNGFTLNTGGSAPVKDVAVMSNPRLDTLSKDATDEEKDAALAARCSMVIQVAGAPPMYIPRQCGRQSWRQVR